MFIVAAFEWTDKRNFITKVIYFTVFFKEHINTENEAHKYLHIWNNKLWSSVPCECIYHTPYIIMLIDASSINI